jgi:CheY-like chemotaxis protein
MVVRTALVVDDDELIREVAQMALEMVAGWQVVTADGGAAALERAAADQPDVILLDVMMPGLDGIATFRRLQESASTRHIPVVLVTAKAPGERGPVWDGLPIAGVIPKPFDPMTLATQVAQLVGWTD